MGLLVLFACAEEVIKKPDNLIPKDKMATILLDLSLLNATKTTARNKFEDSGIDVMEFLYNKYGIDSAQFAQSDLYYASNPLIYQEIYQSVTDKLDVAKKDLEERSKRRSDSIRKANEAKTKKGDSVKIVRSED